MKLFENTGAWLGRTAAAVLFAALAASPAQAQNTVALPQGVKRVQTVEGITEYRSSVPTLSHQDVVS